MKTNTKQLLRGLFLALIYVFVLDLAWTVMAQTNASGTNAPPDTGSGTLPIFNTLKPLEFLLIPAVTVLIQLVRKFVPQIPDNAWPWVAPFIGAILDYVGSKAGIWTGNVAVGAMLGGLGTWFHQINRTVGDPLGNILPPANSKTPPPAPSGGTTASTG
jgi:hypothetical protein